MLPLINDLEQRYLWERDYSEAPGWQRVLIGIARLLVLLVRDVLDGDLTMRAMSLVYTTLLSLVPLLALSFSILKGFGVHNQLEETVRTALEPFGDEKAAELTGNIIGFVNNMNVGVLGAVGLVFLIYTVISLMQKIESSFNYVWRIQTNRSFGERFTTFVSAITIGPLLIFAAIALTGTLSSTGVMNYLESNLLLGPVVEAIARLVPFVLVIGAFTFLYAFIPNTRVRLSAALVGGAVSGVLWESLSFAFASYASGASNYQLIYATFATAILFMIWLYLNWLILLIGASVAYYRQHPELVKTGLREVHFSSELAADYALSLLANIGRRLYAQEPGYTQEALAQRYDIPGHVIARPLSLLIDIGVIAATDDAEPAYLPNVPFDTTEVAEVLRKIDAYQPRGSYAPPALAEPVLALLGDRIDENRRDVLAGLTLKQLALAETQDQPSATPAQSAASG